jgi:hypothetical protein
MKRLLLLFTVLGVPDLLAAQRARPFEIADNSMLVEEAFNQEAGVFQNILLFQRGSGGVWALDFTQEWPFRSQRHQVSYTLPFTLERFVMGKLALNYRFQARLENGTGPAFSPRLTLLLPTGPDDGYQWGWQLNLPLSRQFGDLYAHANAGLTWDRRDAGLSGPAGVGTISLISPHVAGSLIWRAFPLVHVMVESSARFEEVPTLGCCTTDRETSWLVSPGLRVARNVGDQQIVLGAGVPLSLVGGGAPAVLLYFSYELPFR